MEKIITPAFTLKGRHKRLVGYTGQLTDGETVISSKEYPSYHAAEIALDALVFDLLSHTPQAEAEPASTCCFCHKAHSPQSCPEMRALLFAPDKPDTFKQAQKAWADHECGGDSDVCSCQFTFNCSRCGRKQTVSGEEMPQSIDIGGVCEACFVGVCPDCSLLICECDIGSDEWNRIHAPIIQQRDLIYPPLDVDFAPVGFEV